MTNEEKILSIIEVLKAHNRPHGIGMSDDDAIEAIKRIVEADKEVKYV